MDPIVSQLEEILRKGNEDPSQLDQLLFEMKKIICTHNLNLVDPLDLSQQVATCTLRGKVWKAIIGAPCDFEQYYALLKKAQSPDSRGKGKIPESIVQIDKDITRTFKNSQFVNTNQLSKLKRILTVYHIENPGDPYIQGMNSLAAPLLCVMPEVDAYYCYRIIVSKFVSTYFCRAEDGVHAGMEGANFGVALVIITLEKLDPILFDHLANNSANMQKFTQLSHMVFSLGGSTPGIEGLLRLWDVMMGYGFCINPIICALRIIQFRKLLLSAKNPFNELDFKGVLGVKGNLDSSVHDTLERLVIVLGKLSNDVEYFDLVQRHPIDFSVREGLMKFANAKRYLEYVTNLTQ